MDSKRQRLGDGGASSDDPSKLADVLSKLTALVKQGAGEAEVLDDLLEQLGRLQGKLSGASEPAFKAIEDAQARLQAAIVALQAAVDRLTPPPGYRPPAPSDEAAVRSLLSYAHRLSYSSSAPLGYQPGQPLYFFKPPAPQEAEMRASQLHAFAREWEEREQAREAQRLAAARGVAAPAAPTAAAAPAAAAAAPSPAAGDLAALAAQHGLDVKQLLASMPPGWKPGDPISLGPPAAAGAAAVAAAAGAAPPAAAAAQQQQPQPVPAPVAAQREVSPEAAAAPAAPRLAGLFLNELNFEEYDYVSEDEEEDSSEEDSDDE